MAGLGFNVVPSIMLGDMEDIFDMENEIELIYDEETSHKQDVKQDKQFKDDKNHLMQKFSLPSLNRQQDKANQHIVDDYSSVTGEDIKPLQNTDSSASSVASVASVEGVTEHLEIPVIASKNDVQHIDYTELNTPKIVNTKVYEEPSLPDEAEDIVDVGDDIVDVDDDTLDTDDNDDTDDIFDEDADDIFEEDTEDIFEDEQTEEDEQIDEDDKSEDEIDISIDDNDDSFDIDDIEEDENSDLSDVSDTNNPFSDIDNIDEDDDESIDILDESEDDINFEQEDDDPFSDIDDIEDIDGFEVEDEEEEFEAAKPAQVKPVSQVEIKTPAPSSNLTTSQTHIKTKDNSQKQINTADDTLDVESDEERELLARIEKAKQKKQAEQQKAERLKRLREMALAAEAEANQAQHDREAEESKSKQSNQSVKQTQQPKVQQNVQSAKPNQTQSGSLANLTSEQLKQILLQRKKQQEDAKKQQTVVNRQSTQQKQVQATEPKPTGKLGRVELLRDSIQREKEAVQTKSEYDLYNHLDIEGLFNVVEEYLIKNNINKTIVELKLLENKFGKQNIKKLILKGYLISLGKGVTIGR